MKKLSIFISFFCLISCLKKGNDKEQNIIKSIADINFDKGVTPKFTAHTINKGLFNSKDLKGKNVVLVVNRVDQEGHMAEDFNALVKKFKDKNVDFILIIDGDLESENKIENIINLYDSTTIFIDNRKVEFSNNPQVNYTIYCWPAKILMDKEGKVIYSSCGGYGFSDEYEYKLDSLVNHK